MSNVNHMYHSELRNKTESGGGIVVRLTGKVNKHRKSGMPLVEAVDHQTGQETVLWAENEGIADTLRRVPPNTPVLIKGYESRDTAYVRVFDGSGNDVTPPPSVQGFAATQPQPQQPQQPQAQGSGFPGFGPPLPQPQPQQPQGQPQGQSQGDVEIMRQALQDASEIAESLAVAGSLLLESEDIRAIGITLFIHRT